MYYSDFDEAMDMMMASEDAVAVMLLVLFGIMLLASVVGIVSYVLTGMSLCNMGCRRGIRGAGWAWMPFVGVDWVIGKLADHYDQRQTGRDKRFAKKLLVLTIIGYAILALMYVVMIVWMVIMAGLELGSDPTDELMLGMFLSIYIVVFVGFMFVFVAGLIELVALFKVYESCDPKKAIRRLVLSILFGRLGIALCLAAARRTDIGYEEIEAREQEIAKKYLPGEPCAEEEPAEA